MSERTLKQLVGAFAVVFAVWLMTWFVGGGSGSIEASGTMHRLFVGVSPETLEAVTLRGDNGPVELTRDGEAWLVNGNPADVPVVFAFATALGQARVGDLTATNPANHERMGVSADLATEVTLRAAGSERSFLLGHAGRRVGTAYIRLPDSDDVYLLDGNLQNHVTRPADSWRDRTIAMVDTAAIAEVEVSGAGGAYSLVRRDGAWVFADGSTASGPAVQGVLSELSNLAATGFLAPDDSIASLQRASTTVARRANGDVLVEISLGEGTGDRWARSGGSDVLFRVSAFRADRVAPALAEVRPSS